MIEEARRILAGARRIVSFSGAGLSAESGVPTFRDPQTGGMWAKYDPMVLASPEGFAADPEMVIDWYALRRRTVAAAMPNAAHAALARRPDMVHVTQNVDDLLERAGAERVIRLHGELAADRCHGPCGYREAIDLARPPGLRDCPCCGSRLRPDVVWFGEPVPSEAWQAATEACSECEALLVVGTSAAVYPAAGLIGLARAGGAAIVVVNTQRSAASGLADVELLGKASAVVPALFPAAMGQRS